MKALLIAIIIIVAAAAVLFLLPDSGGERLGLETIIGRGMEIKSGAFENGEFIPNKYSCNGEDVSPPLEFEKIPNGTESLAIIMEDPDSRAGTWLHWSIWNINATTTEIEEGEAPEEATEGENDFTDIGYGGPCPGSGVHRYIFKLYALDVTLDLEEGASVEELREAMEGHILDTTSLMGKYRRLDRR